MESKKYNRGVKLPIWTLAPIPIILALFPWMIKEVKDSIHWLSTGYVGVVFFIHMMLRDKAATIKGHWIFNDARDFFTVWDIPIGEFLIYYPMGSLFVIIVFQYVDRKFSK